AVLRQEDELVRPAVHPAATLTTPRSSDESRAPSGFFSGLLSPDSSSAFIKSWKMTLVYDVADSAASHRGVAPDGPPDHHHDSSGAGRPTLKLALWPRMTVSCIRTVYRLLRPAGRGGKRYAKELEGWWQPKRRGHTSFASHRHAKPTIDVEQRDGRQAGPNCPGQTSSIRDVAFKYPPAGRAGAAGRLHLPSTRPDGALTGPGRCGNVSVVKLVILRIYDRGVRPLLLIETAPTSCELKRGTGKKPHLGLVSSGGPVLFSKKTSAWAGGVSRRGDGGALQARPTRTKFISRPARRLTTLWLARRAPSQRRPETRWPIRQALVRPPDILLLDDGPLSALDAESESVCRRRWTRPAQGVTHPGDRRTQTQHHSTRTTNAAVGQRDLESGVERHSKEGQTAFPNVDARSWRAATAIGADKKRPRRLATSPWHALEPPIKRGGRYADICRILRRSHRAVFSKVGDAMLQEATFWALMFLLARDSPARLRTMYFAEPCSDSDMSYFDNPDNSGWSSHYSTGLMTLRMLREHLRWQAGHAAAGHCSAFALAWAIALYVRGWMLALMIVGCSAVHGRAPKAHGDKSSRDGPARRLLRRLRTCQQWQSLCREAQRFLSANCDYLAGPYRKRLVGSVLSGAMVFLHVRPPLSVSARLLGRHRQDDRPPATCSRCSSPSPVRAASMVPQTFLSSLPTTPRQNRRPGYILQLRPGVEVLHGLSLSFPAGQTVALVGVSGCEESTVHGPAGQRFYDPSTAASPWIGADAARPSTCPGWAPKHPREPVLFATQHRGKHSVRPGTSRSSSSLTRPLRQQPQAEQHPRLRVRPAAPATPPSRRDRAPQLSGGQKAQRVALARALVNRRRRSCWLDRGHHVSGSWTLRGEAVVAGRAGGEARQGRTCILIAHRLSTVQNADRIVVIEQGQVVEAGHPCRAHAAGWRSTNALASGAKKAGRRRRRRSRWCWMPTPWLSIDNNNATPPPVDPPVFTRNLLLRFS
uniref:ABC transporter domain-containing protein n=1 Tax=Macrostomum lignano TaxID=282301 RepID=A0A1I8FQ33_9PLAT